MRLPRALTALLAVAALTAGCTTGPAADVDPGTSREPVVSATAADPLQLVTEDGRQYVIGRGLVMEVPDSWTDYEPEKPSMTGDTYEWAVGLPADTRPLPAGVQLSMGMPGKGAPFDDLPAGVKQMLNLTPGSMPLLEEGPVDVPGAKRAYFLRFERTVPLDGADVPVEQVQLFVETPDRVVSTLRFIAERGKWDQQVGSAYDSVRFTG